MRNVVLVWGCGANKSENRAVVLSILEHSINGIIAFVSFSFWLI